MCEEGGGSRELLDELPACQWAAPGRLPSLDALLSLTERPQTYLLQSLVVDEASSILGDLELAFLDLLAKLPGAAISLAISFSGLDARETCSLPQGTEQRGQGRGTYIMRYWLPPSPKGLGARGGRGE